MNNCKGMKADLGKFTYSISMGGVYYINLYVKNVVLKN